MFEDGTVLSACSAERCKRGGLQTREVEKPTAIGTIDIELQFRMSENVIEMLAEAQRSSADIVIVPFPVLDCLKRAGIPLGKCRVIRMVDRINKIASSKKFCI